MAKHVQSVEPQIAELGNGWLKQYGLDYKLEQDRLNSEIDQALNNYESKCGGKGRNIPDVKLLLKDTNNDVYPVLIEYKGYKDKLAKLDDSDNVENKKADDTPNYSNIKKYAVNGAVHYANALLHYTGYTDIIAIGMTGYKNALGDLEHEISVYYVSKGNLGAGQKVIGEYTDFSFLNDDNFTEFIEEVKKLSLTKEQLEGIKEQREREIDASLVKLNNDIYKNEQGLSERDRIYLVAASIMASLGVPDKVKALNAEYLKENRKYGHRDGDTMLNIIRAFLDEKKLPAEKKDWILRALQNTLTSESLNKVKDDETSLSRIFKKIVDDLGIYYKIGLTTDFTGKLFNEMYNWLGFTQDKLNDVVITPSYIATLLAKLARVNYKSYVWDFASGSAGLLVAAMNEMLEDAKKNIKSPAKLKTRSAEIKSEQLLGIEILPEIYMLAVLNMILMGDGSSNILNKDSLKDFNGNYSDVKGRFTANAFVLNPPYSADGNGMVFVEKALSMMNGGHAAIIIQGSAGSGKAIEYNKKILKNNTLSASIKMPKDLFVGKSSVQTYIYVFEVGAPHPKNKNVKFIDFSEDGYTRTNRKKAKRNLYDKDHAKERYEELVDLVIDNEPKTHFFADKYFTATIDPENGADWNQTAPIDTTPKLEDFKKTVGDYLAWEVSELLKGKNAEDNRLGK